MASTKLADATPGTIVKINENGNPTKFLVLQHGYPNAGSANTLLLRKDLFPQKLAWGTSALRDYENGSIDTYLTQEYLLMLPSSLKEKIPEVGIACTRVDPGESPVSKTIVRKGFLLSATELNFVDASAPVEGYPIAYFVATTDRIALYNGEAGSYWTRTPKTNSANATWSVQPDGSMAAVAYSVTYYLRPAFCLPSEGLYIDADGSITSESGGDTMFIPGSKLEQGVEYNFRIFPRNWQNQFQTGIDGSSLHMVVADGQTAEPDDSIPADVIPSYTGNSQIFGDGQKGYIEMYDSGVLTLNRDTMVDIFLVGGGGGGSGAKINGGSSYSNVYGGGGGGGGYAKNFRNHTLKGNTEYPVTIGAGGAYGPSSNGTHASDYIYGGNGGKTSVGTFSAAGGSGGRGTSGGNGGSGGGGGGNPSTGVGGNGGSNGNNGSAGSAGGIGGAGGGVSTRGFMDSQFRLFAGGGGGGGSAYYRSDSDSSDKWNAGGTGGAGGGGNGLGGKTRDPNQAGQANTGGGGGGGAYTDAGFYSGAHGGSGIAIIRWGDWSTAETETTGGTN